MKIHAAVSFDEGTKGIDCFYGFGFREKLSEAFIVIAQDLKTEFIVSDPIIQW